jgi:hypothetical protein
VVVNSFSFLQKNRLACGLYFSAKCDKIDVTGEAISAQSTLLKIASPMVSILSQNAIK